jgi:hypothetical protein
MLKIIGSKPTRTKNPAYLINLLSPFATNKKRYGNKGQPSLSPLEGLKKEETNPFMNTTKRVEDAHPIIHFTKGRSNLK